VYRVHILKTRSSTNTVLLLLNCARYKIYALSKMLDSSQHEVVLTIGLMTVSDHAQPVVFSLHRLSLQAKLIRSLLQ